MRIREVELPTAALAEQREFYGQAVGLEIVESDDERVVFQAGATRLAFVAAGDPGALHFAFNVPENRIADAAGWIEARAPLVPGPKGERILDFSAWNAEALYFFDPGGNVVELIARHSLPNSSDAPFGPDMFLAVSEVGMPVDDVPAAVRYLEDELGLALWDGDRRGFTALGDDHGLAIVVPKDRAWFPTDAPGRTLPLAVTIDGGRAIRLPGT